MKVFYDSKLARVLLPAGYMAVMLFGMVFTRRDSLSGKALKHEETHVRQYWDCFGLGVALAITTMFILFAFGVQSWWMLLLALIPVLLFYALYGAEYAYHRLRGLGHDAAYDAIGFERQAEWVAETWNLPCREQHHYVSFGWWGGFN